jgi:hypothetical protein
MIDERACLCDYILRNAHLLNLFSLDFRNYR